MSYKDHITKFDYMDAREARLIKFDYEMGGETRRLNTSWYRGNDANFLPMKKDLYADLDEYIFKGFIPEEPIITKDSRIVTFGSCFAKEINVSLAMRGFSGIQKPDTKQGCSFDKTKILKVPEAIIGGVNNTFTVKQLLEWAWLNVEPTDETWHSREHTVIERNEIYRQETSERFGQADLFIIVLGLSEVWCNKETGDVFWRAIPYGQYDEEKHEFRNTTVDENKENLERIIELVNEHAPHAQIAFIIDPVPLEATFRPMNCIAADMISKSVIRVAVDEVLRDKRQGVHYFPIYELTKNYGTNPYREDNRHPTIELINEMMNYFCKYYVKDA
jgi:hypothetical protein